MKRLILIAALAALICIIVFSLQKKTGNSDSLSQTQLSTHDLPTSQAQINKAFEMEKNEKQSQEAVDDDDIEMTEEARDSDAHETQFERETTELESYYHNSDAETERKNEELKEVYKNNGLNLLYHAD